MTMLMDRIRANDAELKELSLIHSPDKYFADEDELLDALVYNSNIESVRLHGAFLRGLSCSTHSRGMIIRSLAGLSTIRRVSLAGGRVPVGLVADIVANAHNLNVLSVENVELEGKAQDFSAFEVSLFRHRKLREFSMVDFTLVNITDLTVVDHLVQVLALIPTLTAVRLEANVAAKNGPHYLDGASVASLLAQSRALAELHVSKFLLKPSAVRRIVNTRSRTLRALSITRAGLDNADAAAIAQALLGSSLSLLRELDLSSNDIGDKGCLSLAKSLQRNKYLHTVRLNGNKKIGLRGMAAMADIMHQNNATAFQNLELSTSTHSTNSDHHHQQQQQHNGSGAGASGASGRFAHTGSTAIAV